MRKSTLFVTSLVSLSAVTLAWNQGQQSGDDLLLPAIDTSVDAQPTQVAPSETQSAATEPGQTPTAEPSPQDTTATNQPTSTTKPTSSAPQTPAPAATQPPAPTVVTQNSDPIDYKYGTVQIAMTKTDGTITSIKMVQGDATNGRAEAYVTLINATIQVQGTNYGNISGATFTTDAFKKAVDNVLKKF